MTDPDGANTGTPMASGTPAGTGAPTGDGASPGAVRVGTRASTLAQTQTATVVDALTAAGLQVRAVPMTSDGDRTRASLASLGGTGVFAANLRRALLAGECDAVVHSLKDLPTTPHPGLRIAATPAREDARDVLCARDAFTVATLPEGARVGTGSPRRAAQLRTQRPDLQVADIRGNVQTRLGFVTSGELDAVVLAAAGLHRVRLTDAITEYLPLIDWPTAPGQGVLAVEVRDGEDRTDLLTALAAVHDENAWAAATAERAVLARLEAGCAAPVAAHAQVAGAADAGQPVEGTAGGTLRLHAAAYHPTAGHSLLADGAGDLDQAADLGQRLAEELLAAGAGDWITPGR